MAKKNGKTLVIVESPAKAKTINKYLGDDYVVRASMGHVRDLPKKGIGVNLETFEPEYVLIEEKGKEKSATEKIPERRVTQCEPVLLRGPRKLSYSPRNGDGAFV